MSIMVKPNADKTIFKWIANFVKEKYRLVGIADMIRMDSTIYEWDEDAENYHIFGNHYILVYERRDHK